jgi:hypothetical protein
MPSYNEQRQSKQNEKVAWAGVARSVDRQRVGNSSAPIVDAVLEHIEQWHCTFAEHMHKHRFKFALGIVQNPTEASDPVTNIAMR